MSGFTTSFHSFPRDDSDHESDNDYFYHSIISSVAASFFFSFVRVRHDVSSTSRSAVAVLVEKNAIHKRVFRLVYCCEKFLDFIFRFEEAEMEIYKNEREEQHGTKRVCQDR